MMMIGDPPRSNPTVQVPPWDFIDDHPTANIQLPFTVSASANGNAFSYDDNLTALQRYLPSNTDPDDAVSDWDDLDITVEAFSCDQYRMFEFKVKRCVVARSHDWTECPYAHPGEKARRRDPRKYHYSGCACPDFRKGGCRKGDSCEFAHGVFEFWLHPARYRTQPCKDGTQCRRKVCFFAHTADQLRVLSQTESYDGSCGRLGCKSPCQSGFNSGVNMKGASYIGSSPTSVLYSPPSSPPSESPPMSPSGSLSLNSMSGLALSMRNLQIANARMCMGSPRGIQMGSGPFSPRSPSMLRPGFTSLPATPTRIPTTRAGSGVFDPWEKGCLEEEQAMERVESGRDLRIPTTRVGSGVFDLWEKGYLEEEHAMERVESGRDLRAKMYEKLSKENSLDSASPVPDFGWISELVK